LGRKKSPPLRKLRRKTGPKNGPLKRGTRGAEPSLTQNADPKPWVGIFLTCTGDRKKGKASANEKNGALPSGEGHQNPREKKEKKDAEGGVPALSGGEPNQGGQPILGDPTGEKVAQGGRGSVLEEKGKRMAPKKNCSQNPQT